VRKWLGPDGGLDGWRVDVANMTGRYGGQDLNHEVAREMRVASVAARADALVVGEHTHDYTTDLRGDGWHGVMNYAGFTRPVWTWLTRPEDPPEFLGQPVRVPRLGGELVAETMRDFSARVAWSVLTRSFIARRVARHLSGAVARRRRPAGRRRGRAAVHHARASRCSPTATRSGSPVTAARTAAVRCPGTQPDATRRCWDERLHTAYRSLIGVRRESVALRRGGMRWLYAGRDALVYLREAPGETALVHIARDAHPPITLDARLLPGSTAALARFGGGAHRVGDGLRLEASAPSVGIHTWVPTGGG
jgi:alpha-glucosidase